MVFYNYYTVASTIVFAITLLLGLFPFSMPDRTRATRQIIFIGLSMAGMSLAYTLSAAIYHPLAAYHRWFTVAFVLPAIAYAIQFFLIFPTEPYPRFTRYLHRILLVVAGLVTIYFIIVTYDAPLVFHFDGDYWDFDTESVNQQISLITMSYILGMLGLGIYRLITEKEQRFPIFLILLAWTVVTLAPGISNALSREGIINRNTYIIIWNVCVVVGLFIFLIAYINYSGEQTTFMTKIMGVSLVTLLLVMQGVSYYSLNFLEQTYNEIQQHKSVHAILDPDYRPAELSYLIATGGLGQPLDHIYIRKKHTPDLRAHQTIMDNAHLHLQSIQCLARGQTGLTCLQQMDPRPTAGSLATYDFVVETLQTGMHKPGNLSPVDILAQRYSRLNEHLHYHRSRIRRIPRHAFSTDIAIRLRKMETEPILKHHVALLKKHFKQNTLTKKRAQVILQSLPVGGERQPRIAKNTAGVEIHYLAFHIYDPHNGRLYEAGYSYTAYREFINPTALRLLIILIMIILIVVFGYRLFFMQALLKPLANLLSGVRRVNAGNLNVRVPVKVEDEIGFLSRSFNRMVESIFEQQIQLKEYADSLEEKVAQRTADLQESLDQVQSLKQKQDGDYFLTALLTRPFIQNRNQNEYIQTDFLIKQKKQFEFRQRNDEIGGDLCSTHTIRLRDRAYLVFLNADAMGKSIQGAGGVLVLGAVFESIITRTQISNSGQVNHPERWLKDAFAEMHKIFESFSGCMLVSLVFGLLDERSGLLYYLNAEHPESVLYRAGTARFLNTPRMLRKLGSQEVDGDLCINILQLQPGDILITGSDGRDDILLHNPDGIPTLNEDENLFLKLVESSSANLELIAEHLHSLGEITDDLSLLRLEYTGQGIENYEQPVDSILIQRLAQARAAHTSEDSTRMRNIFSKEDRNQPAVMREIIGAAFRQADWTECDVLLRRYLELIPADTAMIQLAASVARELQNFDKAIRLADRVRLRQPENLENLIHLAQLYHTIGKRERVRHILKLLMVRKPDHAAARALLKELG